MVEAMARELLSNVRRLVTCFEIKGVKGSWLWRGGR